MGWIIGKGIGVPFRLGGSGLGSSYWATRYISALSVLTTSDTEQTVTATIVGTGYDGVSFEYSDDNGITWTIKGTSSNGIYNATSLTADTYYSWRARLYKGSNYGNYSSVVSAYTAGIIFNDTFTDADSTSLDAHTPDVGSGWSITNAIIISGNRLQKTVGNLGTALIESGKPDVNVSADFTMPTANDYYDYIVFRRLDASHFWAVILARSGGGTPNISLQCVGGIVNLSQNITHENGVTKNLRVLAIDANIKVFWDEIKIIEADDNTYLSNTIHGLVMARNSPNADVPVDNYNIIANYQANTISTTIASGSFFFYNYTSGIFQNISITNLSEGGILFDRFTSTKKGKFNHNIIRQADTNAGVSNQWLRMLGTGSECNYNDILLSGTNTTGTYNKTFLLFMSAVTAPLMIGNLVETTAGGYLSHIECESLTVVCGAAKLNNNRVLCRGAIDSALIGLDIEKAAAQHNHFDGFEINDNICYAPAYYGNGYGTMHGIVVWGNNGNMLRNYVNGAWIGCLMKGADLTVVFSMSYNKLINCGISLYIKGVTGAELSYNFVDSNCIVPSSNCIFVTRNVALKAQSTNIHHNTLIYRGSLAAFRLINLENADCLTGFQSDYNTFYTTQSYVAAVGASNYTFAQWQALGYDTHSTLLVTPPVFDESEL